MNSLPSYLEGDVEQAVRVALAAAAGARQLTDPELSVLYSDLIETALSEAARKALQMLPQGYEFQSETVKKSMAQGIAQGVAQGQAEARKAAVLAVLEARGLLLTQTQRAHIEQQTDLATLDHWIRVAATAVVADELFS